MYYVVKYQKKMNFFIFVFIKIKEQHVNFNNMFQSFNDKVESDSW